MATLIHNSQIPSTALGQIPKGVIHPPESPCSSSLALLPKHRSNSLFIHPIRQSFPTLVPIFHHVQQGTSYRQWRTEPRNISRNQVHCQLNGLNNIDFSDGQQSESASGNFEEDQRKSAQLSQDESFTGLKNSGRASANEGSKNRTGVHFSKFLIPGSQAASVMAGALILGALAFSFPAVAHARGKKNVKVAPPQPAAVASAMAVTENPKEANAVKARPKQARVALSEEDVEELLADEKETNLIPLLQMYLKENPEDVAAMQALLKIHMQEGQFEDGLEVLELLIEREPEQMEWRLVKAQAQEFMGDLEMAREGYQSVLKKEPYSAKAMQGLATVMQKSGEDSLVLGMLEEAIQEASQEGKHKLEVHNLKLLLGQMHTLQGNVAEALQQYDELIKEDPDDFRPYLCQGLVYSLVGNKEQADESFRQFQMRCPEDYAERSHVDTLMLKAKTAARRMKETKKRQEQAKAKGKRVKGDMEQPRFAPGDPRE